MIKLIEYPARADWPELVKRPENVNPLFEKQVRKILLNVKNKGDAAVEKYTRLFDKKHTAPGKISAELEAAIRQAKKNIENFHTCRNIDSAKIKTMPGVCCWTETRPIEKAGLYIPGGTAPLFSTILMLAVPAKLAGCRDIILCCPSDHPAIIFAAKLCGVTEVHKIGGAQAIAAMAYGTETVSKVDKIFGPGNQYVTLAKQLVQQEGVAIDMPAGPSELLIIADESANAEFVAADLLSQAEHGEDSQVFLVTNSRTLALDVQQYLKKQAKEFYRLNQIEKTLENSRIILMRTLDHAVEFSNLYAPEHLEIICANAENIVREISCAGSVFIGNYSPVSAGDYATGPNHTLPTNGYAASHSGVSIESFQKKIAFQQLSKQGLKNISSTVMIMAENEGLEAHKNAIAIRLKN